jgi:hypothetical protein
VGRHELAVEEGILAALTTIQERLDAQQQRQAAADTDPDD